MLYERMKKLRKEAKLSQVNLAKDLSMHTTTYRRYESGERDLPMEDCGVLSRQSGLSGRPHRCQGGS